MAVALIGIDNEQEVETKWNPPPLPRQEAALDPLAALDLQADVPPFRAPPRLHEPGVPWEGRTSGASRLPLIMLMTAARRSLDRPTEPERGRGMRFDAGGGHRDE